MIQKRTILLIGKTGNGKSALANVLGRTNIFKESSSPKSCTEEFKKVSFQDEKREVEYTVYDTPGISDTNPKKRKRNVLPNSKSCLWYSLWWKKAKSGTFRD